MSASKRRKQRSSQASTTRPSNGSRSISAVPKASTSTSASLRSSGRQVKLVTQGFNFGGGATAVQREQRDAEKVEKELARERRRKEQRIEELERGTGPSGSWNDSSGFNVLPASTSAAAIAGLLAGRQAEQEETYEDLPLRQDTTIQNSHSGPLDAAYGNKRKQSAELKRLLTQRRSLKVLLEDAAASPIFKNAPNNFLKSLSVNNPYPIHRATGPVCSICGYWGDIRCLRCHERVCGLKCSTIHNETRCERRL